ncbi:MAG: radical SAM family heme chaperone HemW [Clostridia bacterium]|nr:radical SAM family heme chaperone HemW [Clostridia bacterium]
MNNLGVYIHIPFCVQKCLYCDFYSLPGALDKAKEYIDKACGQSEQLSAFCRDRVCDSIYVGGGTPSILPPEEISRLIGTVRRCFGATETCEITVECNPGTVSRESFEVYKSCGVNRISLGVQSYRDETLARIGRIHRFSDALDAVDAAHAAGIGNVSCDLMYALPGQTEREIVDAFERLSARGIRHVSLYGLKIEENTPFAGMKLRLPDEEEQAKTYLSSVALFEKHGFYQYEISNFAVRGYESRHNLRYWNREEYLGIGPAAHSFFDGVRFCSGRDLEGYLANGDFTLSSPFYVEKERISQKEAREEELMLSLRLTSGYSLDLLYANTANRKQCELYVHQLMRSGLAVVSDGRLILTPEGMLVSNSVISDLLLLYGA